MPSLLIRQYATSIPPASLALPVCSKEACDTLISIIHDAHLNTYAPARAYRTRFFKRVVDELEARADYPIHECIYETFLSALSSPEDCAAPWLQVTAPSPAYKTHFYPLYDLLSLTDGHSPPARQSLCSEAQPWGRLTVFESPALVEAGTTGLRTWRSALWMAEWLLDNADVVRRETVLELGSGTGFLGILIAQIQLRSVTPSGSRAGEVWMTDNSEAAMERCAANVHLPCNNLQAHGGIHLLPLDWTCPADELQATMALIKPDVVLACDVIFDASLAPDLVRVIGLALATAKECWLACAVRNEETTAVFIGEAEGAGLDIKSVDWGFENENERVFLGGNEGGEGIGEVRLMRLTKNGGSQLHEMLSS
ncbi:hypothetical protein CALCODRAFT_508470 [Calocera cornea HHB12733]|uniref:FAM86 N-terminal domain-containing protein n=1 Tax=Calocera cornea HHB12733 TaxID=1353952 RepID=A0A165GCF8_9BASI|nr:hypothetical protein CALCODRAFT_508470 [Calocera cornea HHB12733]